MNPFGRTARRSEDARDAVIDTVAAKVEATSVALEKLIAEGATKQDIEGVMNAVHRTHKLLEQHMDEERAERAAARAARDAGILSMLGDILARLPG